ncbi:MAG: ABC transporter ATP-binding protein, partial [Chloroflexia bacterium]|nr:ABC transporter ATP-binding protein [Chloroflexia bacterium]
AHMQRLSLSFHAKSSTGDLLTRLTGDVNMLRELLVASMLSFISEVVVLVGFVSVMFWMEWRLALASVVVIPVVFALVTVYSGRIRDATRKQRKREGELASRLHQALNGIHIVQLFAREDEEDERLRGLNKRSLRSGLKATRLEAQLNRAVELSLAVGTAVTLWLGALQVIAGRLTPGELIVFVSYMQSFYRPLRRISRVAERATKADSCVERITNVLDQASDVWDGWVVAPRSSGAFKGALRFRDMTFEYKPGRPVLREIDFAIAPGQTVALVGPTGAGKSTLLGLVPRLWDPSSGVVEVDGRDVRDYTLKSLRDQIAVVPQDGMLFSGTIRENILYGKPEATVVDLEAAARAARIHDHIVSLPEGYDTSVGERGVTLSGGQRQRLAIARALVKDAPIVLLDEPTTGLDAESESLVMEALDRLLEGRTALVIAHRLATVRRADLILVLDEGRVVESGTHEDLLAAGGRYRALYDRQFDTRLVGRGDPAHAFV